jgi:predicted phage tail protein
MGMKKMFGIVGILLTTVLVAQSAFIADVWLTWSNNPSAEFVEKYIVYQAKLPSTNFIAAVTVTTNVARVRLTQTGTYQFKVTAINGVGESPKSESVQIPKMSPSTPSTPIVTSIIITNN